MKKSEVSNLDERGHGIWAEIRNGHIHSVGSENGREGGTWWRKSWGDRNDRNYIDIARDFYENGLLGELREKAYNDVDKLPTVDEMEKIVIEKETELIMLEIEYHSSMIKELRDKLKNLNK